MNVIKRIYENEIISNNNINETGVSNEGLSFGKGRKAAFQMVNLSKLRKRTSS